MRRRCQGVDFKALRPAMIAGAADIGVNIERFTAGPGSIGQLVILGKNQGAMIVVGGFARRGLGAPG